jgi:hypothetical protein
MPHLNLNHSSLCTESNTLGANRNVDVNLSTLNFKSNICRRERVRAFANFPNKNAFKNYDLTNFCFPKTHKLCQENFIYTPE